MYTEGAVLCCSTNYCHNSVGNFSTQVSYYDVIACSDGVIHKPCLHCKKANQDDPGINLGRVNPRRIFVV